MDNADLAIIGAGPAGMAAAETVAAAGGSVVLLDEQREPGGQIYRSIERMRSHRPEIMAHLGTDYAAGAVLVDGLRRAQVDYRPDASVWDVSADLVLHYSRDGRSQGLTARNILVANGALERAVPIPGWTLPGVMTVGALQILLKADGLVPDGPLVLAGSGPLLLLLAHQLLRLGAPPAAVVETVRRRSYLGAARHLPRALRTWRQLAKGQRWMLELKRSGVPWYGACTDLEIEGNGRAETMVFRHSGRTERVPAEIVGLHQGVVANTQITRLLGCDHIWIPGQRCFRPQRDDWLMTTVDGVFVAGDGGGSAGAVAAELQGRLAGLAIAQRLDRLTMAERDQRSRPLRTALAREQAFRPMLEALYAPPADILCPADDVVVCRCEEVTAGQIREAVRLGCPGPNQAKSFLRCGMGPCQGRVCGLPVAEIIADARGVGLDEVGYYRIRPPLKPLPLTELAALDSGDGHPR